MATSDKSRQSQETFFWVKGGQTAKRYSIHQSRQPEKTVNEVITPKLDGSNRPISIDTKHAGLQPGWTRASFIVREANLNKIKALAYWERRGIKEVLDEALLAYLGAKEDVLTEIEKAAEKINHSSDGQKPENQNQ
jgi:hypothetical protein